MSVKDFPVVKEVAATLKSMYGQRLSKIILYGSFARGEQHEDSDIDFLVVLKDEEVSPYREIDFYGEQMSRLSDKYKIEVSVKASSDQQMQNTKSLLAHFISKEGILISP